MNYGLSGLAAIVTGGGSGIGLATAIMLNKAGADVFTFDLTGSAVDSSSGIHCIEVDVTDGKSVRDGVTQVSAERGGVDIVINNAGIGAQGTIVDNSLEEWFHVLDVNVLGVVRTTRAALPYLEASAHAAVVNTCSIAALAGLPKRALYSASKGAVYALTLAMAADYIHAGIRVNCVTPGTTDTPWIGRLLASSNDPIAERAALNARQPNGRLISADEVAAAICYLASPSSGSTTGTALPVDGGMLGLRVPAA